MSIPKEKWQSVFPNIWDMNYTEESDMLKVYLGRGEPLGFFGKLAQEFYDSYKKWCSSRKDPSERVTPLERVNEDGLYSYDIDRKNTRKMMNVTELAQDDTYHEVGHIFLDSVVGMQHASDKYLKVLLNRRKVFGESLKGAQSLLMAKDYDPNDFKLFERMILVTRKQEEIMKEMNDITLELLERYGPA